MSRIIPNAWPLVFLITLWWLVVIIFDVPHFILPTPDRVAVTLLTSLPLLGGHALTTALEIICGLMLGSDHRIFGRLFDRRLETTAKVDHAGISDQPSVASFCHCTHLDALARLRLRIQARHDNLNRLFSGHSKHTCWVSSISNILGYHLSNIQTQSIKVILVCATTVSHSLCHVGCSRRGFSRTDWCSCWRMGRVIKWAWLFDAPCQWTRPNRFDVCSTFGALRRGSGDLEPGQPTLTPV